MPEFELPYFGKINIDKVEQDYSTDEIIEGKEIEIDINFENYKTTEFKLEIIKEFLNRIPEINLMNIKEYEKDFLEKGTTATYLEFYMDELEDEELEELIDTNQAPQRKMKQLLGKLELTRIGLYPDVDLETRYFGVFDYSIKIEGEFFDYLLVVKTKANGELDHITWES